MNQKMHEIKKRIKEIEETKEHGEYGEEYWELLDQLEEEYMKHQYRMAQLDTTATDFYIAQNKARYNH